MRILIADDELNLRKVLKIELSEDGNNVSETGSGLTAAEMLEQEEFDVLLLDLNMPGLNGMEVLKKMKELEIPTEVVIFTGHGTISSAVEAMKLGAYDYLSKPIKIEELKAIIEKAYEKKVLVKENLHLKFRIKRQMESKNIVTRSTVLRETIETSRKVARSEYPILITGESGVGKELFARFIHENSERTQGPFIPINCGAIPENMIESELFGHERGAFTGAHTRKPGLMEIADDGTLFLDEIGEMPLSLQVKLLRAIEMKSFFRVGGTREIKVNTKFVFATNRDLKDAVEKGNFREDLFYRIIALVVHVPPLRERKEDIPLLIEHFIGKSSSSRECRFSKEALEAMMRYPWPGNIRELQNVIHRILLLSKKHVIEPVDLPVDITGPKSPTGSRLEDIERDYILKVLKETGGNRIQAAEILGINRKTLYRKLTAYGMNE